jgi:hypothetical protein
LRVFVHRPLRSFDTRLLAYASHSESSVRCIAHKVLAQYSDPHVRELAIARISKESMLENELEMLNKNYLPGDARMIKQVLVGNPDVDKLLNVVSDLVDLFSKNTDIECEGCMHFVYEQSPCSNCRGQTVKNLLAVQALPRWMVEECRFDSLQSTRYLAEQREHSG